MNTLIRVGASIRRAVTQAAQRANKAVNRLPYFPDPQAQCVAHGRRYCRPCHRNNGQTWCTDCGVYETTGMHWDTCANRVRGAR